MRNWPMRVVNLLDMQKAKRERAYPECRFTDRYITYNSQISEIEAWAALPAEAYAVDVESGWALFSKTELERIRKRNPWRLRILSSQLSMVGFARSPTDALVIPFMTRENTQDMSYWPDSKTEVQVWKLVARLLETDIDKIFQNGVYDMTRLAFMGLRVRRARRDTMLYQHAYMPELPKGLGFLGSIHADERAWKTDYEFGENLKRDN